MATTEEILAGAALQSVPHGQSVRRRHYLTTMLFVATAFTASSLLFLVQPLFAKMVLPRLGGSPAVWNTCVLFFQTNLLLGYLFAHITVRWLGPRRQAVVQSVLLLLPLAVLPITIGEAAPEPGTPPVWWLLGLMTRQVGVPFLMVATIAPLLQRWFAALPLPSAADPYFLYAASNLGSMLALLAFPFVLEPSFGVTLQSRGWGAGYMFLIVLVAGCAATVWRTGRERPATDLRVGIEIELRLVDRWRWILFSFVPSSLMLGVTTHISTDVAAVPLLWILPLALYLVTFIVAFSGRPLPGATLLHRFFPLLALLAIASSLLTINSLLLLVLHLATFFVAALVCHQKLAHLRPPPVQLTEFYLWLSFGGMLGGVFNTLVAPHVFDGSFEYPLVLALACLVWPRKVRAVTKVEPLALFALSAIVPILAGVGMWSLGRTPPGVSLETIVLVTCLVTGGFWAFSLRRLPFNVLICSSAVLLGSDVIGIQGDVVFADRSFFGVLKVIRSADGSRHELQHGTTLHGRQDRTGTSACEPLSYYHPKGPIGDVFRLLQFSRVAVVGLGTGALACYAEAGEQFTFYEIDPLIERIARDSSLFTFLRNSRGSIQIILGDGRKMLEHAREGGYDLIVLDAFSSDSVPVHLITTDALRTYVSRLRPSGVLAFHISNRYLDLEPVIGATSAAEGLASLIKIDGQVSDAEVLDGHAPSQWVVVAHDAAVIRPLAEAGGWLPLKANPSVRPWTDDYSNLLSVLKIKFGSRP